MFSITQELKSIPTWFTNFNFEKLFQHPAKSLHWIICTIQICIAFGFMMGMTLLVTSFASPTRSDVVLWGGFLALTAVGSLVVSQILILGLHTKSKLAWLLVASLSIRALFSPGILIGIWLIYLLDRPDAQIWFQEERSSESVELNP